MGWLGETGACGVGVRGVGQTAGAGSWRAGRGRRSARHGADRLNISLAKITPKEAESGERERNRRVPRQEYALLKKMAW